MEQSRWGAKSETRWKGTKKENKFAAVFFIEDELIKIRRYFSIVDLALFCGGLKNTRRIWFLRIEHRHNGTIWLKSSLCTFSQHQVGGIRRSLVVTLRVSFKLISIRYDDAICVESSRFLSSTSEEKTVFVFCLHPYERPSIGSEIPGGSKRNDWLCFHLFMRAVDVVVVPMSIQLRCGWVSVDNYTALMHVTDFMRLLPANSLSLGFWVWTSLLRKTLFE